MEYLVKMISAGRPGGPIEGQNWVDGAVRVPGEPIAVIEDRSQIRIYYREPVAAAAGTEKEQMKLDV